MSPYKFIAIEGNIGAGKTSLAKMISQEFNAKLILEEFEHNSFLPKFYSEPDRYAFPLELSFLADRYQQLKETVNQQELFSPFTISDYLVSKSLIFARKTLQNDEYNLYHKLFNIIYESLPKPELIIHLYVSVENLQRNIKNRGRDYEQSIKDEYLQSIQESYFDYIKQQENQRIVIIDTNELDFVKNPGDYEILKEYIFKTYEIGIHRISPLKP